jgi:hypothetical protein
MGRNGGVAGEGGNRKNEEKKKPFSHKGTTITYRRKDG